LNEPSPPVSAREPSAARIVPRSEHSISRAGISPNALKVLYRLKEAGFQAFLVGGAVRDLLLGLQPKDFDIATDARPDELRRLFRNSRLIGRRFRLAHVFFGSEIIEVATFRAATAPEEVDDDDHREVDDARATDDAGRILRDNVYGTIEEDVWRRDFAANGLYYNIADFSIWDYVGGVEDVSAKRLRLIGDPVLRYREDPVRLLRAARFAAKLGFSIDPATRAPMRELAPLLAGVPAARLFDETMKLFLTGNGLVSLAIIRELGLLAQLIPGLEAVLEADPDGPAATLVRLGLENTDQRVSEQKSVTPTFLFAVLLFGPIMELAEERFAGGMPEAHALADACDSVIAEQVRRIAVPKRFTMPMRELYALQPRFLRREGRRGLALLQHPRFRAAYDFFVLTAKAGAADPEIAQWWTEIQELPAEERLRKVAELGPPEGSADEPRRRRRRRGRRAPAPTPS
jgi:poly(A) polymerase